MTAAPSLIETPNLGTLPEWQLDELFSGLDGADFQSAIGKATTDAAAFAEKWQGEITAATAMDLATAIKEYEALEDSIGLIATFAGLTYAQDASQPQTIRAYGETQAKLNTLTAPLIFFTLEINQIEEEPLNNLLAESPTLAHYRPWLDDVRTMRPHELPADQEHLLHEKQVTGRAAWTRLFDETFANLTVPLNGENQPVEVVLDQLQNPDGQVRKSAAAALSNSFKTNMPLFTHITNTLAKDKAIEDRWRKFSAPEDARHLANQVEAPVVDALEQAVADAFPALSHRYYAWKAAQMGVKALDFWDRNAPLPQDDDRLFTFDAARETVLTAYQRFSPALAEIGQTFFDKNWIDAPIRPGKAPGAFSHPAVPSTHPFILLNYMGRTRDVMTLAHELGHGVHQVLAADQGALMADTPLTLAETASVFGEMLTFQSLLKDAPDDAARRTLLAGKVEDMLNTVVRQIAFYRFERRVHADIAQGRELTADDLGQHWLAVQRESLGNAITLNEGYENW
ncbi:MAG: M3 family oligoendopeptidase, partial [Alphaproteobacteria bacterium]